MRKRGLIVLSLMIAMVIMLVPMAGLKARAEEPQLCSNIIEHHVLRGTIIKEDGSILTYPEETIDAIFKLTTDFEVIDEQAYIDALTAVETKLNNWASENGYTQGCINVTAGENNVTRVFYDPEGNVIQESEFYDGCWAYESGESTVIHEYYYDAQNGRTAPATYEVSASVLDFNECAQDDVAFPVDCISIDEITGVFLEGVSTDSEGNMDIMWSDYSNCPFVTLMDDFFADVPTGEYQLKVMFTGDRVSKGTTIYVTKWSLECIAGNYSNYEPGSKEDIVLTFDAFPDERIDAITINGDESIPSDSYERVMNWEDNHLEIHIKGEYLEGLVEKGVTEALLLPHFHYADRYSNAMITLHTYTYEILEGESQTFDPTKDTSLAIRIDGPDDEVIEVLVDGAVISADNYDITKGSTVLTFHEDYLKTLAAGDHVVTVNYEGDHTSAPATITVTETKPADDNSSDDNSSDNNSSDTNSSDTNSSDTNSSDSNSSDTNSSDSNTSESTSGDSSAADSSSTTDSSNTSESSKTESSSEANSSAASESGAASDNSSKEESQSSTDADKPKTGDNGLAVAASLLMISLIGVAGVLVAKRKLTAE